MTYEQIEKEFDELFVKKVMLIDEPDKLAYEEMKYQVEPEAIKSFLKQSFIKYLQSEVERLDNTKKKVTINMQLPDAEYYFREGQSNAISDQITHITNQIKELDTSNNPQKTNI